MIKSESESVDPKNLQCAVLLPHASRCSVKAMAYHSVRKNDMRLIEELQ